MSSTGENNNRIPAGNYIILSQGYVRILTHKYMPLSLEKMFVFSLSFSLQSFCNDLYALCCDDVGKKTQSCYCKLKFDFTSNKTHPHSVQCSQRFCCFSLTCSSRTSSLRWLLLANFRYTVYSYVTDIAVSACCLCNLPRN